MKAGQNKGAGHMGDGFEAQGRERWLPSLLRIMRVSCSATSMREVLNAVSSEVLSAIGATACGSFLFADRAEHGYYCFADPQPPEDYYAPDPPDRLAMEAMQTKLPVAVADCVLDERCDQVSQRRFGIASALAFPLVFQDEAIAAGLVWFAERHEFTQDEIDVVMGIAQAAAMAVANAKLNQENLQLAIAQERNRLAQELHDSVCQSLATTKLSLNLLLCTEQLGESVAGQVRDAIALIDQGYADVRDIVHSFRAAGTLETDAFPGYFKNYLADFAARTKIHVENNIPDEHFGLLSTDVLLQVARILGEAASNVRKHSWAQNISFSSKVTERDVVMTIEDDGIGFDISSVPGSVLGHFGLSIMRERANIVSGDVRIESVEPHGTRVVLSVPYR